MSDEKPPRSVNVRAQEYMRDFMAMPDFASDQEQNWILRHLVQFGMGLLGEDIRPVATRRVREE